MGFLRSRHEWIHRRVEIEERTYNFGPTRFLYYLTFEDSRLVRIELGDYGYMEEN